MQQEMAIPTYYQIPTNTTYCDTLVHFDSSGTDPRKGWRTPLNINRYSEQRDAEPRLSYFVQHRSLCRFASSGKERDAETGLSYFGARYYDADLTTGWLSVDPMSDKYPSMSPYNYCAWTRPTGGAEHRWIKYNIVNNPIKLVDPDGNDWYEIVNEDTGEKEIKWTDYHSQEEMDNNKLSGTYLGKSVVVFNGYNDESLGTK